jgi:hypothetical protein
MAIEIDKSDVPGSDLRMRTGSPPGVVHRSLADALRVLIDRIGSLLA